MSTATLHSEKKETLVPKLRFPEFDFKDNSFNKYSFKDIFQFSTGKNIKQNEASPDFETPCVRYGELYHMYNEVIYNVINKTNLDRAELVFSKGNEILLPSAGEDPLDIGSASALTIENVAIGRTINILRPIKENVYSQIYASYYINEKLRKKISKLAKGSSISNVYNSDLKTLEITLPSLSEQQKIALFLSAVDEKTQQLSRKKELLEQYKKGVMQQLFSRKLRFKDENGTDYADWEEKTLDDIIHFVNGKGHEQSIDNGGDFIVVNSKFVSTQGRVRKFCNTQISPLQKNDIVMVMSDVPNGKTLAKCYLIEMDNLYTLNQRICGLKAKEGNLNEFLIYLLNRNRYYLAFDSGVGQTNLKKEDVLNCPLYIPNSIEEQQKIANFLSGIDVKIENTNQEINQMQNFKKGLLQQLFA
ncbi:restriction endonuclease subunit S [Flavobacterium frigidarium]|uniref:Restriction endonuclease subunit S n=1 Tax=Flavobacterium frigidarium TaxID=99286 RepID=A0ABV4KEN3_9FLAO